MALYDLILADAPYLWYRFEPSINTNAGSANTGTFSFTPTNVTQVAGAAGTTSAGRFAAANSVMGNPNISSDSAARAQTAMTVEMAVKRNNTSTTHRILFYRRSAAGSITIGIAPSNAAAPYTPNAVYLENTGGTGSTTRITGAGAVISDTTTWHHVAITSTGTVIRLYVDGVEIGNGAVQTMNTGTSGQEFWIGGGATNQTTSADADIDEFAVYKTTLTAAKMQARATSLAPPGISVSNLAPAATVSLSTPNANVKTGKKIAVPAMTVNLSAVAPVVTAVDVYAPVTYNATADRDYNGNGTADKLSPRYSSFDPTGSYIKFAPVLNPSDDIEYGRLRLYVPSAVAGSSVLITRITQDWTEAGNTSVTDTGVPIVAALPLGFNTVDITSIVKAWNDGAPNYGIRIQAGGQSNVVDISSREATTVARPTLIVKSMARAQVPTVTQAPAMTLNITGTQTGFRTGTKVAVPAGSVTISSVAPAVSPQRNLKFSIPAITLTQLFPGGESVTPDVTAKVDGLMGDYYFSTPDAKQYIEVPSINQAPVMEIGTIGMSDITLNFNTDRKVKVNNTMSMTTRLVGIYNAEADRYVKLVDQTVDGNDVWLPLDDLSGNVARDLATFDGDAPGTNGNNPASYYRGTPELAVDGPYLRKAVRFDGVDDFVQLASSNRYLNKTSFEFSIRTTQQNGTILSGGGQWDDPNVSGPASLPVTVADNQPQIRLVDGKITLFPGNNTGLPTYVTSAFVADGEWHHVIVSIPYITNLGDFSQFTGDQPTYVAVDGRVRWTRYTNVLAPFRPLTVMAAGNVDSFGTVTATRAISGDMSHLIVRDSENLGQALPQNTAQKLYYEWSNATLIQAEPMVVNLSMPDPHRARGNRKRMIVLMGLPRGGFNNPMNAYTEAYTYWSIFAGYYIGIEGMPGYKVTGPGSNSGNKYQPVAPFVLEDYICYPVAVFGHKNQSGNIQLSAEGMEKAGLRDPMTREILDDETGLHRFINLQTDLNEPIENYDAITALNYPAEEPTWDANTSGGTASRVGDMYDPKQFTRLTATQWKVARDKLRDSVLDASYNGVSLWVNEPQMAQHLGVIQAYDTHAIGYPYQNPTKANPFALEHFTYERNQPAQELVFNRRGDVLDAAHVSGGAAYSSGPEKGNFLWVWQANAKRVIAATEPGLTDLPGAFIKDQIDYQSKDRWQPHSRITAYEVLKRPEGLQVGDSFQMPMTLDPSTSTIGYGDTVGNPRRYVVSARPEGIVGKVISKEVDFYYGANGAVVPNPFAGNVITLAVERGTMVRGRPIMGRIFVEFMSPDTEQEVISVDTDKSAWQGDTGRNITTWDFDSRRYRELVSKSIVNLTSKSIKVDSSGGTSIIERSGSREIQWYEKQVASLTQHPYMSMNARGLYWIGQLSTIPAGTIRTFAVPMEITLNAPAPKVTRTGGAVSKVIGPMRVDIDLRQPKNYRGADYREKALPMVINITLVGTGKVVKAGPMELNLNAPTNVRGTGSGDRIFVYMDAGTNVTLFMEEK